MTSKWQLSYAPKAAKWLKKTDPQTALRIRNALSALVKYGEPRQKGKSLTGTLSGLWRYRVGDYRIICDLVDERLTVLVIDIDHRSRIYD